MKLSLFTEVQCPPSASPSPRLGEFLEQVERADALGFHGLWIAEIHFQREFSLFSAPYPVLGAVPEDEAPAPGGRRERPVRSPSPGAGRAGGDVGPPLPGADGARHRERASPYPGLRRVGVDPESGRAMMEESLQVILAARTQDVVGRRWSRDSELSS